jgi:hypothetical protein
MLAGYRGGLGGIGRGMGDYVLEGNPALDHLFERLGAPDEAPRPAESASSDVCTKGFLRRRRSTVRTTDDPEVLRGDPTPADAVDSAERATVAEPANIADEEPVFVEDDLWAIHEDTQPTDEMLLVDFDEEPEVFDEEPVDQDEGDDGDEDEILDIYEGEDLDYDDEAADEDELPVTVAGASEGEGGDWIFDAFEVWMLEAVEDGVVHDDEDLDAFDEDEADADEYIDVFDEDTEEPIEVPESPDERREFVVNNLLEPMTELYQPYEFARLAPSSQLSVNAGRTKAQHKKFPKEKKRL